MIEHNALEKAATAIGDGACVRDLEFSDEEYLYLRNLGLLTLKPIIYVFNTDQLDSDINELKKVANIGEKELAIMMDIKLEAELAEMDEEDRELFKDEYGISESGLERLTKRCYKLLGLQPFFTSGEDEARAWTINEGETAPEAAGRIHGDFEKKFICAEVIAYDDFVEHGGEQGAKEKGKLRLEGKGYIVQSGDVIVFRHGA